MQSTCPRSKLGGWAEPGSGPGLFTSGAQDLVHSAAELEGPAPSVPACPTLQELKEQRLVPGWFPGGPGCLGLWVLSWLRGLGRG